MGRAVSSAPDSEHSLNRWVWRLSVCGHVFGVGFRLLLLQVIGATIDRLQSSQNSRNPVVHDEYKSFVDALSEQRSMRP
jgi:hypothetical protein